MPSDGEITKNQEAEGETKPSLDTTDSSQDSVAANTEPEDEKDKSTEEIKEEKENDKEEEEEDEPKPEEKQNNDEVKETINDSDKTEKNDIKDVKDVKNNKEKKKEVKSEDDEEEEVDEEEEEEENSGEEEAGNDKKDVPLLDQPLEKSGKRERKNVQRFNDDMPNEAKEGAKLEIPEGEGTQLGEIPRIDASISRFKTDDLKLLHKILFKMPGKTALVKKNIKKFNGFDFKKDSEAYTKKVQFLVKMDLKHLKSICEMLDLEKNGKKEDISERICEFLVEPKDSGKPVGGGRPKRTAAVRANNRGYSSHDDDDDDSDPADRRASRSRRGKGKRPNLKEETSSESDAEFNPSEDSGDEEKIPRVTAKRRAGRPAKKPQAESEEEASELEETPSSDESDALQEPKSKRKKGPVAKVQNNKSKRTPGKKTPAKKTPAKKKGNAKSAKKRSKNDSESEEEDEKENSENNEESSSGDDEPLVKKSKAPQPPTDDEIKTYVKEILEGANLEEITMKTVCKQVYAHYPEFDLAHKKDFIKTTVKSLIST